MRVAFENTSTVVVVMPHMDESVLKAKVRVDKVGLLAGVGVCMRGYNPIFSPGGGKNSWGLWSHGRLSREGMPVYSYHPKWSSGDVVDLEFNERSGELLWWHNGTMQEPVRGIFAEHQEQEYPALCVGSRGGGSQFTIVPATNRIANFVDSRLSTEINCKTGVNINRGSRLRRPKDQTASMPSISFQSNSMKP